jgi:hypothetical protein
MRVKQSEIGSGGSRDPVDMGVPAAIKLLPTGHGERGGRTQVTTTGYSGTPLPRKLGIGEGARVAIVSPPADFDRAIGALPAGAIVRHQARGRLDVIVFFVTRRSELARRFPAFARALVPDGGLWVAWPKRTSGVATDLGFDIVQRVGLDHGLVDNKVCAIDATWSGLRFVYRLEDRPGR